MSQELVTRYFEMWNTGNTAIADDILDPQWVDHSHPEVASIEDVKNAVRALRAARSSLRFRVDAVLSTPDMSADDLLYGVVGGVADSNLLWLIRVRGGRLVEMWTYTRTG